MLNVCSNCGLCRADKKIDPIGPFAICPECGHRHFFKQLPLLTVGGPSGTGETAVARDLIGSLPGAILLEADILWQAESNQPDRDYQAFFDTWLRLAKNISAAGQPVTLFCAGAVPRNVEPCMERRYFSEVHYLALTCEPRKLTERLRHRPGWRDAGGDKFIPDQLKFSRWIVEKGQHEELAIRAINTGSAALADSSGQVAAWIKAGLKCGRFRNPAAGIEDTPCAATWVKGCQQDS